MHICKENKKAHFKSICPAQAMRVLDFFVKKFSCPKAYSYVTMQGSRDWAHMTASPNKYPFKKNISKDSYFVE